MTLAGWGVLWLILHEQEIPARVVIQNSSCSYLRPVSNDFTAFCPRPVPVESAKMVEALRKHGRARLELQVEICNPSGVAVLFTGRYVVMQSE